MTSNGHRSIYELCDRQQEPASFHASLQRGMLLSAESSYGSRPVGRVVNLLLAEHVQRTIDGAGLEKERNYNTVS